MKTSYLWHRTVLLIGVSMALAACSSTTQVTTTQELSGAVDAPFEKILVVSLFDAFDPRAYLEKEVVLKLAEFGADAVASTTMMNSKTPVTRDTFIAMVDEVGADALLLTQLTSLESKGTVKDMRPRRTLNYWPTYYYNVFEVQVTEYVEPQGVEMEHTLVLATVLYSVKLREPVWGVTAQSEIVFDHEQTSDYNVYIDEAESIAKQMRKDGLIARK